MSFQKIEKYEPKNIVLGKIEDKYVKFFLKGSDGNLDKITFQLPIMRIVFDIEEKKTRDGRVFVKNVSVSTKETGSDNNKKRIQILRSKIEKTEEYIRRLLPEGLRSKTFLTSMWQGKNTDFSPVFKASLNYKNDECSAGVFDEDNSPIDSNSLEKGQYVSMAITLDKLWVWNDKIGLNWEVNQIKIHNEPEKKKMNIRSE